jgi:hypothetical protein
MNSDQLANQLKNLRTFIWRVMDVNHTDFGLSEREIALALKHCGFDPLEFGGDTAFESLISEVIRGFAAKGLIQDVSRVADKENSRWRISTLNNSQKKS